MDFETKEAMEDFLKTYERDSPTLYPDAEMLLMIKTTETSCVGVSVYPNEEARSLAARKRCALLCIRLPHRPCRSGSRPAATARQQRVPGEQPA